MPAGAPRRSVMHRRIGSLTEMTMATSEQQRTRPNGAYVDAGGVNTYYEVTGAGEPVLLLHGGMCTAETLDGQTPSLAERYRVFVPERRGHGRTPDVDGPLSYGVMADDTIALMDTLGIGSAHLVGWSDGASVALLVALRRPERVRKLVLIGQPVEFEGARPEMRAMLDSFTSEDLPPMLRQLYAAASPDGPAHFDAVFDRIKPSWRQTGATLEDLGRVQAPTLVLIGEHDVTTIEHAAAMQRALPHGRLGVVPGATHALPMEKPELTSQLLLDFLADP